MAICRRHRDEITEEAQAFIEHAVSDLAEGPKSHLRPHCSVRRNDERSTVDKERPCENLAERKEWELCFLKEMFGLPSARPLHRLHERAARELLKSLLPPSGMSIKGSMRSVQELAGAFGIFQRSADPGTFGHSGQSASLDHSRGKLT